MKYTILCLGWSCGLGTALTGCVDQRAAITGTQSIGVELVSTYHPTLVIGTSPIMISAVRG